MKEHDKNTIVESQAFKAINLLIDDKVADLQQMLGALAQRCQHALPTQGSMYNGMITVRTSYEPGPKMLALPFATERLKELREIVEYCERQVNAIGELQRFKLRLLNDYDFTHGDAKDQRKVFGKP